jgi:hypothetical protein
MPGGGGEERSVAHRTSRRDRQSDVRLRAWGDGPTVGEELAGVVEQDDAVAQQAPSLLGMGGDGVRGLAVGAIGCRTRRLV